MNRLKVITAAACATFACRDATGGSDPSGVLRVNVTTAGSEFGPDHYTVTLDSISSRIATSGTVHFPLSEGDHLLRVTGQTRDCRIREPNRVVSYHSSLPDTLVQDVTADCVAPLPDRFDDVILFSSGADSASDVYAIRPDGTGLVNVTHDFVPNFSPTVSPDGRSIAFVTGCTEACTDDWCTCLGPDGPLEAMNADRSARRSLGRYGRALAWSPDGARMAFVEGLVCPSIRTMPADGGPSILLSSPLSATHPAWSPDGATIAFGGHEECSYSGYYTRRGDIFVMNADGTDRVRLTFNTTRGDTTVVDGEPAWAPDGSAIAFSRSLGTEMWGRRSQIYVMHSDGTDLTALTPDSLSCWSPAWAPDGSRIAFVRDGSLYIMDRDGLNVRRVVTNVSAFDPVWAPRAVSTSLTAR